MTVGVTTGAVPSGAEQGERVRLRPRGPMDLDLTLETGQAFRWRRLGAWWAGIVGPDIWKVRQAGGYLELESGPRAPWALAGAARRYFRLGDDLPGFYRRMARDPRVSEAASRYRGLRLLRQDPWECLVSFIISAFSNVPRITGHIEQLCRAYGDPIRWDGLVAYTFPSPERLAEVGEDAFRAMGLGYRSRFLARLARSLLDQGIDLGSLRKRPYNEAKAVLLGIHGVGEKVADCVLLFSLDKLEACPIDVWVRRALTEWYHPGERITDRALRLWAAERFGSDAGYVQQYLFHRRRLEGREARRRGAYAKPISL